MLELAPRTGWGELKYEVDRLLDLLEPGDGDAFTLGEWAPKLDLCETKDALVVRAEVPTIDPKDINLTIKEGVLTIKGEKKAETEDKNEKYFRIERTYGTFTRRVLLPMPVDEGKVDATFKNGLLTVTLPKTPLAKGTAIPIKTT
jgi:HSP20 family protein